jgi:hypothetical protein
MAIELTQARLLELLSYDAETGIFRWLVYRGGSRPKAGSIAGRLSDKGYVIIGIDDREYRAHRLAFLYMVGRWPVPEGDHRDLNRANNIWSNLREATRSQNMANTSWHDNRVGFKGVYASGDKYAARIQFSGKATYLGTFDTAEFAGFIYAAAAQAIFGEFARTS